MNKSQVESIGHNRLIDRIKTAADRAKEASQ